MRHVKVQNSSDRSSSDTWSGDRQNIIGLQTSISRAISADSRPTLASSNALTICSSRSSNFSLPPIKKVKTKQDLIRWDDYHFLAQSLPPIVSPPLLFSPTSNQRSIQRIDVFTWYCEISSVSLATIFCACWNLLFSYCKFNNGILVEKIVPPRLPSSEVSRYLQASDFLQILQPITSPNLE